MERTNPNFFLSSCLNFQRVKENIKLGGDMVGGLDLKQYIKEVKWVGLRNACTHNTSIRRRRW